MAIPDTLRILLVEDNPGDVVALRRALKRTSPVTELVSVDSAEAALRQLGDNPGEVFGLMLLDINLPKMSGLDLLAKLRSEAWLQNTPVMILSTSRSRRDVEAAFAIGIDGYLVKPAEADDYYRLGRLLTSSWEGTQGSEDYGDLIMTHPAPLM